MYGNDFMSVVQTFVENNFLRVAGRLAHSYGAHPMGIFKITGGSTPEDLQVTSFATKESNVGVYGGAHYKDMLRDAKLFAKDDACLGMIYIISFKSMKGKNRKHTGGTLEVGIHLNDGSSALYSAVTSNKPLKDFKDPTAYLDRMKREYYNNFAEARGLKDMSEPERAGYADRFEKEWEMIKPNHAVPTFQGQWGSTPVMPEHSVKSPWGTSG